MTLKRERYKPALNSQCLCGSGLKFKRCCSGQNDVPCGKMTDSARVLMNKKDFKGALKYVRHGITNYSILHKTNTEPYVHTKNKGVLWFLDTDIKALSELVEYLLYCYRGLHDYHSLQCDLERLRVNIFDIRWQRKITYFQILASLGEHWSEKIGKKEVKKLLPIDNENDVEIIQLYLHFCSDELSFKKNIDILDRLLSIIKKPGEQLQYKVIKGIKYLCIGDEEESKRIIQDAISDYESTEWTNDNAYAHMQHARAISLLGDLKKSAELKVLSIKKFTSLLDNHTWTDSGIADIHSEIGQSLFHIKKFDVAIEHYMTSLEISHSELVKVYLSQVKLELNDETAITIIKEVELNIDKLSQSEFLDFIFSYTSIGIAFKQKEMINKSIKYLSDAPPLEQYFEKQKTSLISQISLLCISGDFKNKNPLLSKLKNFFTVASRYLILEPNIAGFGININNILQDLAEKPHKKDQPKP
ncbi:YecA family protein [Rahnella aceris]|uniref:YecA family protein n=1 Tax=Rahnella sp. (strain Y9602) TaxID=2703885 RepID=A0ABW6CBW8_RAHSY